MIAGSLELPAVIILLQGCALWCICSFTAELDPVNKRGVEIFSLGCSDDARRGMDTRPLVTRCKVLSSMIHSNLSDLQSDNIADTTTLRTSPHPHDTLHLDAVPRAGVIRAQDLVLA